MSVPVVQLLAAALAAGVAVTLWLAFRWLRRQPPRYMVIDGSNVMYWQDNVPSLSPVIQVLTRLTSQGYAPCIIFDANAGHKLVGRYCHHDAFARMLGLPANQVMVVPKGTQADAFILAAARDLGSRIVTNDRYRDWAEAHPEVAEAGHLIRGGFRDGQLWLTLGATARADPA